MSTSAGGDATYALAQRFKYLRLSDVSDGLDFVGRANMGLVDPAIRPLAIQDRLLASQGVAMPAGLDEMDAFYEKETALVWTGQRNLTEALTVVGTEWRRLLQAGGR